jgi:hypothetical protein
MSQLWPAVHIILPFEAASPLSTNGVTNGVVGRAKAADPLRSVRGRSSAFALAKKGGGRALGQSLCGHPTAATVISS